MIKKILLNLALCSSLLFQQSCLTKALWGKNYYTENIEKFLIGADGKYIVFLGAEYHYVLADHSGILRGITSLRQNNILTINSKKTYLDLASNNDVEGYLVLQGPFGILPPEDVVMLRALGFSSDIEDNIVIKIKLVGRRYQARYLGRDLQNSSSLNAIYKIPVYYSDSSLIKGVGKAAVTPVTVTLDAVILIGKMVVAPFSL